MATDKPRFTVSLDDDLFEKVEDYRHNYRISTRSKAVAQFVQEGINAIMQDHPELSKQTKKASSDSDEAMQVAKKYENLSPRDKQLVNTLIDAMAGEKVYKLAARGGNTVDHLSGPIDSEDVKRAVENNPGETE